MKLRFRHITLPIKPFGRRKTHKKKNNDDREGKTGQNLPKPFKEDENEDKTSRASEKVSEHSDTTTHRDRQVRFKQDVEIIPDPPYHESIIERRWYNNQQCESFFQRAVMQARVVHALEQTANDDRFWTKNLERAYEVISKIDDDSQTSFVESELDNLNMDACNVGLETYCIPSIFQDCLAKRHACLQDISRIQNNPSLSTEERTQLIRDVCQQHTRVSQAFAHFIAKKNLQLS
jgi:hypothetical protein